MRGRLIRTLSSPWATALLLLAITASYIFFMFFPSGGNDPFAGWADFVSRNPLGLLLYLSLLLNMALSGVSCVTRKLGIMVPEADAIKNMDTYTAVPRSGLFEELSMKMGLKPRAGGFAQRGRHSFLPGLILRLGLIVFMSSLLLSAHLRKTEDIILAGGGSDAVLGRGITIKAINTALPDEFLEIGAEGSSFRLKGVSAKISSNGRELSVDSGLPSRDGTRYYRISDMGFFQNLSLDGGKKNSAFAENLDVLPPGRVAKVALESGHSLVFRLEPEKIIKKGLLTGRLYNLKNPLYRASLTDEGGKTIGEATLRPGETARLGGPELGTELSLGGQAVFLKITAVHDPALIFIYAGLILSLLGLFLMPLRFFWYERRMRASTAGNELLLGYTEEFFGKWGIEKFHRTVEGLLRPESSIDESEPSGGEKKPSDQRP